MNSYDKRIKLYIFLLILPLVAGLIFVGVFFKMKLDKLYDPTDLASRQGILHPPLVSGGVQNDNFAAPFDLGFYEAAFQIGERGNDAERFLKPHPTSPSQGEETKVAGIAPHHLLSADMIAEFYLNLAGAEYDTIILIGPNHFDAGDYDIAISKYDWETPYGILEADREMANSIYSPIDPPACLRREAQASRRKGCVFKMGGKIFQNEHSINSHVAFIKRTFPNAKFLPIILKSSVDSAQAKALAGKIYETSKDKKILVLASIDFPHYKDSKTAAAHDKESIEAIEKLSFDKIYELDIDSPASLYALMDYGRMRGSEFKLLNNSNSAILAGKQDLEETTSYATGYFVDTQECDDERNPL